MRDISAPVGLFEYRILEFTTCIMTIGVFALIGLGLAVGGVYAVVSFAVGRRTREIGIRRALGAETTSIVNLVTHWSMVRVAVGITAGVVLAIALDGFLQSFLFGVETTDPITIGMVAALMGAAGLVATWLPINRAVQVDPVTALRSE